MVPPNVKGGKLKSIEGGSYTVEETIATLEDGTELQMMQRWPVRVPRPVREKKNPTIPLITGQRILDGLFPIAKGGTAAIPGPFGSGKTVTQQQLAKWSDAEIVVYIGCGERGNEMTEVLTEFPELQDPKSGKPLMERTILIANTSNMPVAAREASVYTGITIAEYFRDMGYDVSLMADSTSRWAEAMREISSRLEEMPGEEGYPAYLAARLAEFYERSGLVTTLNGDSGSVSVIGAVSPPGGDFSEPVTQNTLRIVKVFWALDAKLSQRRHFPSINWLNSYSLYLDSLADWYDREVSPEWNILRSWAMEVLQKEAELQEIVQLVGSDALPEAEQITIEVARLIREVFLQQNAYDPVDTFCSMTKQYDMMKAIRSYADLAYAAQVAGVPPTQIITIKAKNDLPQIKFTKDYEPMLDGIMKAMEAEFTQSEVERMKEYRTISKIAGPLLFVQKTEPIGYGELVNITLSDGSTKRGQVLDTSDELVVVQVFESTAGLGRDSGVRFTGEAIKMPVGKEMLGRILSGGGKPIDGGPEIVPEKRIDITGAAINPFARGMPADFIQTGISTIDGTNTLVRGQKLPIFSAAGLPHNNVALQIARQAKVPGSVEEFAVVFAGMGITKEEANAFMQDFERTGALERAVVFLNLADDPAVERIITPRLALTTAEYLAFELGMHVLVILTDMTNYCEALRQIGAAREEVPGRRGYPGYMYTDLASIYERAGMIKGRKGSVTQIPILTMPGDDITHPIPDLTGYITEGQIVVSRELHRKGIYPPINVLPSLSRLMNLGIGSGKTREDHKKVSDQLYAAYAEGNDLRGLVAIVGKDALSERDRTFLEFADLFEGRFVRQGIDEDRAIGEGTLDLGWDLLATLPVEQLSRIDRELIEKYHPKFRAK